MLAEERRLMYVAMTRAKQTLVLSTSNMRRIHGTETTMIPSRFIEEIPEHLRTTHQHVKNNHPSSSTRPVVKPMTVTAPSHPFSIRTKVYHDRFGEGVVLATDGMGDDARVQVRFSDGARWLLLSLAKLEKRS